MAFWVYIFRCADGSYYTGHTDNLEKRILDFVLSQYVKEGVDELDQEKLSPLLKLKYKNAIADAMADLGNPEQIRNVFVGFQKYLYQERASTSAIQEPGP